MGHMDQNWALNGFRKNRDFYLIKKIGQFGGYYDFCQSNHKKSIKNEFLDWENIYTSVSHTSILTVSGKTIFGGFLPNFYLKFGLKEVIFEGEIDY